VYDYSYDAFQRLEQVNYPNGSKISYTYDANNQIKTLTAAPPAGSGQAQTTTYDYDGLNRLEGVGTANGSTSFDYDPLGLLTAEHLPNGVTSTYGYDNLNRLTNISQQKGGTVITSYTYTLDNAGNRLGVAEAGGQSIQWTYDNLYRLTSETRKSGSTTVAQTSFTYDAVGNRLSQQSTTNGHSSTVQYTYNELDQLTSANSIQYQYDERGNLAKETNGSQVTEYQFDAANRLAHVILPGQSTVTNTYDADGRRVKQVTGSQTTNYLWDETSLYGDVVLETTSGVNTSYALAGNKLISQSRNGATSYYLQDGQGSTRTLTNSAGTVTDTYDYTAFGEIYNQTGTTQNKYLYTGQQADDSSGLYSLRTRFYSPNVGRFLSQDTYDLNFNNPIELNRYGYVAGNPVNSNDPSGNNLVEDVSLRFSTTAALISTLLGSVTPAQLFAPLTGLVLTGIIVALLAKNCGCDIGAERTQLDLAIKLITILVVHAASDLFYFSAPGNQKNHIYWAAVTQSGGNHDKLCEILDAWYKAAKSNPEKAAIKIAQKAAGCRHSRHSN
jgi:RHS repeat-associated protein